MTVRQIISEPLIVYKLAKGKELYDKVSDLMDTVGLARRMATAYPHELDGGRRPVSYTHLHTKYTDFRGDPELRQAIAEFYQQEYGMLVDDSEIFVTAGGCIAMYLALEAILDDGDEVIMQAPYFTPYLQQIELARGIPVELPTYEEEGFQINFERLQALTNERTRAIIINSPSNPTGSVMSQDKMEMCIRDRASIA